MSNTVNNDPTHQYVDLIEADDILSDKTRSGDAFPGDKCVTEFTDETTPALKDWNNTSPGIGLYEIAETEDGVVSFEVRSVNPGRVQHINEMADSLISIEGNTVNLKRSNVMIYDCTGQMISREGERTIRLFPGIYVASDGQKNCKFIIH